MFLAAKYITRLCLKARQEGFEEGCREGQAILQARWVAWFQRLEAAEAAGVKFTEPPPTLNKPGKPVRTNRNKRTASAF